MHTSQFSPCIRDCFNTIVHSNSLLYNLEICSQPFRNADLRLLVFVNDVLLSDLFDEKRVLPLFRQNDLKKLRNLFVRFLLFFFSLRKNPKSQGLILELLLVELQLFLQLVLFRSNHNSFLGSRNTQERINRLRDGHYFVAQSSRL